MPHDLDLSADIIDTRDLMARVEALETDPDDATDDDELSTLLAILNDLQGNGGDEQWRGHWYPVTLVRDDYFTDYAREMVEESEMVSADLPSWVEVDWDATARNVRMDYTATEIDGVTYWYR
jgi:hypothetical protein